MDSDELSPRERSASREPWRGYVLFVVLFLALVGSFGVGLAVGWLAGALMGESGAYHRRYLEEKKALDAILRADPAFASVQIHEYSDGGAYLTGEVPTEADKERLDRLVVEALGKPRGTRAARDVSVK